MYILKIYASTLPTPPVKDQTKREQTSYLKDNLDRLIALTFLIPLATAIAHLYNYELFTGIYPGGLCGLILIQSLTPLITDNHLPLFLFMLTWATVIVLIRFSCIRFIKPLAHLLQRLPLTAIFYQITTSFQTTMQRIKKRLTPGPLTQSSIDIPQTVFKEPVWEEVEIYEEPTSSPKQEIIPDIIPAHLHLPTTSPSNSLSNQLSHGNYQLPPPLFFLNQRNTQRKQHKRMMVNSVRQHLSIN